MFWNYTIWNNAFIIQTIVCLMIFAYGYLLRLRIIDLLIVISLYASVPVLKLSNGVDSVIFLSDFLGLFLFLNHVVKKKLRFGNSIIRILFCLLIVYPILITLTSILSKASVIDVRWAVMQLYRYFVFFVYVYYVHKNRQIFLEKIEVLLKLQTFLILLLSIIITLSFFEYIKVDVWWEIKQYEVYDDSLQLGKGSMFMYRAGLGAFSVFALILLLFHLSIEKYLIYRVLIIIGIVNLGLMCVLSGSKQGLLLYIVFFIYGLITFNFKSNTIYLLGSGFVVSCVAIVYGIDYSTFSTWFHERFVEYLVDSNKIGYNNAITGRNQQFEDFNVKFNNMFYYIIGRGVGSDILKSESDYFNAFGYFGLGGILLYLTFVIKCLFHFGYNERYHKLYFTLFLAAVLFGFQQWFIITWHPYNGSNNILVLFYIGLGIRNVITKKQISFAVSLQ